MLYMPADAVVYTDAVLYIDAMLYTYMLYMIYICCIWAQMLGGADERALCSMC